MSRAEATPLEQMGEGPHARPFADGARLDEGLGVDEDAGYFGNDCCHGNAVRGIAGVGRHPLDPYMRGPRQARNAGLTAHSRVGPSVEKVRGQINLLPEWIGTSDTDL